MGGAGVLGGGGRRVSRHVAAEELLDRHAKQRRERPQVRATRRHLAVLPAPNGWDLHPAGVGDVLLRQSLLNTSSTNPRPDSSGKRRVLRHTPRYTHAYRNSKRVRIEKWRLPSGARRATRIYVTKDAKKSRPYQEMGARIWGLREERGLTRKALGEKVGISETTVYRHETGRDEPKMKQIDGYARVFDTTAEYLRRGGVSERRGSYVVRSEDAVPRAVLAWMATTESGRSAVARGDTKLIAEIEQYAQFRQGATERDLHRYAVVWLQDQEGAVGKETAPVVATEPVREGRVAYKKERGPK